MTPRPNEVKGKMKERERERISWMRITLKNGKERGRRTNKGQGRRDIVEEILASDLHMEKWKINKIEEYRRKKMCKRGE